MKAKLIKTEVNYLLENKEGVIIASTSIKKGISSLSKQNCDEIFGSYNPESMMKDILSNCEKTKEGYILGFQMAMELNKNKVFTIPEVIKLCTDYYKIGLVEASMPHEKRAVLPKEIVEDLKLLRPTEIEVEIVMETKNKGFTPSKAVEEIQVPKLDSSGCLILKKL